MALARRRTFTLRAAGRVVVSLATLALLAGDARAADPGEEAARKAFEDGLVLEKHAEYAAALAKFIESAARKETLGNRFHAAFCREMLGSIARAHAAYEAIEREATAQNRADVAQMSRQRADALKPRLSVLELTTAQLPAGGEVQVDGNAVVAATKGNISLTLEPGEHVVSARAPEHENLWRPVTLGAGERATVDIVMVRSAAVSQAAPPPTGPGVQRRKVVLPWVTVAGAVTFAVGGTVAFFLAGSNASDARASCPARLDCDDERSAVRTWDALALTGWVSAAALGIVSYVLFRRATTTSAAQASASF